MGIKQKLVILSALAGLVVLLVSVFGYLQAYQSLEASTEHELRAEVRVQTEVFDGWLREKQRIAVAGASLMTALSGQEDVRGLQEMLSLQGGDVDVLNIAYGDETGYFRGFRTGVHEGTDVKDRPWYRKLRKERKPSFTEPYEDLTTNQMVVSAIAPFEDQDGQFAGGLCVDITLGSVLEQVREMHYLGEGNGFLFDRQGSLIASSDGTAAGQKLQDIGLFSSCADRILGQEEGFFETVGDDIVAFARIPSTGWLFCLAVPEKVVFAQMAKIRLVYGALALFGLAAVALMFVFCLRFSSRIIGSVSAIEKHAREIAQGNLALGALEVTSKDEIGSLTASFNTMRRDLHSLVRTMSGTAREVLDASGDLRNHVQLAAQADRSISGISGEVVHDMKQQMENIEIMLANVDTSYAGLDELCTTADRLAEAVSVAAESFAVLQQDVQLALADGVDASMDTDDGPVIGQCFEGLAAEILEIEQLAQAVQSMARTVLDDTGHAVDTVGAIDEISRSTMQHAKAIESAAKEQEASILEIVAAVQSMDGLAADIRDAIGRFRL